jgi:hypothetical protein
MNATRTRLAPATGWVRLCGREVNGNRLIQICVTGNDEDAVLYEVEEVDGGWDLYHMDKNTWEPVRYCVRNVPGHYGCQTCDCPDATNRPERKFTCKHVRGLRAALKQAAATEPF